MIVELDCFHCYYFISPSICTRCGHIYFLPNFLVAAKPAFSRSSRPSSFFLADFFWFRCCSRLFRFSLLFTFRVVRIKVLQQYRKALQWIRDFIRMFSNHVKGTASMLPYQAGEFLSFWRCCAISDTSMPSGSRRRVLQSLSRRYSDMKSKRLMKPGFYVYGVRLILLYTVLDSR